MIRRISAVIVVGFLLGSRASGDEQVIPEVKQALQSLNEAFQKGDAAAIKKLATADHVAVTPYYGKPMNRNEQVATLPQLKLTEYAVADMQLSVLGRDVVLVTYSLTMRGTFNGKPVPRKNFASAVWLKHEGRWLEKHYQETALDTK